MTLKNKVAIIGAKETDGLGVIPPQVLPPSSDFMTEICWKGTALPPS